VELGKFLNITLRFVIVIDNTNMAVCVIIWFGSSHCFLFL